MVAWWIYIFILVIVGFSAVLEAWELEGHD